MLRIVQDDSLEKNIRGGSINPFVIFVPRDKIRSVPNPVLGEIQRYDCA